MRHETIKAPPRRDEVLAIILERIARDRISPTYEEIGLAMRPKVSEGRARQLVDQLVQRRIVGRIAGRQRNLVVLDDEHARVVLLEEVFPRLGWRVAQPMGELEGCAKAQLPMLSPFEHLPDID